MKVRKRIVRRWVSEHVKALNQIPQGLFDEKLERECAYYPVFKFVPVSDPEPHVVRVFVCKKCSWEKPNRKCERAHILIDTRIECEVCGSLNELVKVKDKVVCKSCVNQAVKLIGRG